MKSVRFLCACLALVGLAARAHDAPKSSWTLRPLLSAQGGYDDNVFLQDRSATVIPGGVPDRAGSWFTRVAGGLDVTWKRSPALQLDAGYSVGLVRYEAFSDERHDDHRVDLGAQGKAGPWSYSLKGNVVLVDGADDSPVYGHAGGAPAIGGAAVRARRDQLNTKLAGQITRTFDAGFMRGAADSVSQDFQTRHASTPGYANYVDRSEWTVGVDGGRFVVDDFAVVVGVRTGEQRQADLLGVSHNYTNTLTRVLLGVEGHPRPDLSVRLAGGPDFRHYGPDVANGFDRSRTGRYLEASVSWKPDAKNVVGFTYKDFLWLSSGGRGAYQNSAGNVQWKHEVNARWSATLAADVQVGDNHDYGTTANERVDWIYTGTLGVTRTFGPKTKLDLSLSREWSESAVANKPGREYTHWLTTVGVSRMF
ncbi:MAG: hypothetical protein ABW223_04205 [Rariglobus sp.]